MMRYAQSIRLDNTFKTDISKEFKETLTFKGTVIDERKTLLQFSYFLK